MNISEQLVVIVQVGGFAAAYVGLILHYWRFRHEKRWQGPDLRVTCDCHHKTFFKRGRWVTKIKPVFLIENGGGAGTTVHQVTSILLRGDRATEITTQVQYPTAGLAGLWVGAGEVKRFLHTIYLYGMKLEQHTLSCRFILDSAHGHKTLRVESERS